VEATWKMRQKFLASFVGTSPAESITDNSLAKVYNI
jgi:hypothetical protein